MLGAGAADERGERGRGDVRHQPQRLDVVGVVGPLVVADQRAIGLAARRAELVFVDLLEQLALVELDGPRQIALSSRFGALNTRSLRLVPVSLFITR